MSDEAGTDGKDGAGLLDTSVFIALESGRPHAEVPRRAAISVVTLALAHQLDLYTQDRGFDAIPGVSVVYV